MSWGKKKFRIVAIPSKLLSGWRETIKKKIHTKSKCNRQNKISSQKKKNHNKNYVLKKIQKNVHAYVTSILKECFFFFFSYRLSLSF